MKRIAVIVVLSIAFLCPPSYALNMWVYSGVTQGSCIDDYGNGCEQYGSEVHQIYFRAVFEDTLWDLTNDRYADPTPGTPLPGSPVYTFRVHEWYADIIGVGQISGSSGLFDGGRQTSYGLEYFDALALITNQDETTFLFRSGNLPESFSQYTSPSYGQLPETLWSFGYWDLGFDAGSIAFSEPLVLTRSSQTIAPVPEPTTILLIGIGLAGFACSKRRKN